MSITSNKTKNKNYTEIANIPTIERIKEGFNIWKKGWLSFILAIILVGIVFLFVIVPAALILEYFEEEGESTVLEAIVISVILIVILSFIFILIGTMCGLGKELIEIEDTRAENSLHYLKNYGLQFAGIGLIISLIVFGPLLLVGILFSEVKSNGEFQLSTNESIVFGVLVAVYFFLVLAPFTLSIPAALIDDIGPVESIKTSINLFRKDPKAILLLFGAFGTIFAILFAPVILFALMFGDNPTSTEEAIIGASGGIAGVIAFIMLFPVMLVTLTKLYYDYKFPQKMEFPEEEPPVSLI
ncbi:MAG: hypothetical protein Q6362_010230 [Candidatus Wukongarchaeota archaeon]|nr:hypothetical protein [Candidatus Wukongarchaeota archaeon]